MVADFGLAKFRAVDQNLTLPTSVLGSPSYMAPEQVDGAAGGIGPATDVYSLGAILYELLTGRPPIVGHDPVATLQMVTVAVPDAGALINPSIPSALDAIALKCLEKKPERRYRSASELAEDLDRWLRGEQAAAARSRSALASSGRFVRTAVVSSIAALLISGDRSEGAASSYTTTGVPARRTAALPSIGRQSPVSGNSVAVLPFADLSETKDQEYLSDGLSEEIIYRLVRFRELHVPGRASAFYFKDRQATIAEVAKTLGVAHVLQGSVRKSGDHLRVTARLVRADDGYLLWSGTYDKTLADIATLRDEIVSSVVSALNISQLTVGEPPPRTRNAEAYRLQLLARFYDYHLGTRDAEQKSVDYYEQAIKLDPSSATAWEGLSRAVSELPEFGILSWQEGREAALSSAERALLLDPSLAAAHIARGKVSYYFDYDWNAAAKEFAKARLLDPADPFTHLWAGLLAATVGRQTDALQLFHEALLQDPLNKFASESIAATNYRLGRFAEAEAAARQAIELWPAAIGGNARLASVLLARGDRDAALAEVEREPDQGARACARVRTYWLLGRKADSDAALGDCDGAAENWPYAVATVHAVRGEVDQAFRLLERAYQLRDSNLVLQGGVMSDVDLRNLRQDPRYKAFLRKMMLTG
jgi:TolB-like protein